MDTDYAIHGIVSGLLHAIVLVNLGVLVGSRHRRLNRRGIEWGAWGFHEMRWWAVVLLGAGVITPVSSLLEMQFNGRVDAGTVLLGWLSVGSLMFLVRTIQEVQIRADSKAVGR